MSALPFSVSPSLTSRSVPQGGYMSRRGKFLFFSSSYKWAQKTETERVDKGEIKLCAKMAYRESQPSGQKPCISPGWCPCARMTSYMPLWRGRLGAKQALLAAKERASYPGRSSEEGRLHTKTQTVPFQQWIPPGALSFPDFVLSLPINQPPGRSRSP